jgi:hypothetical protein
MLCGRHRDGRASPRDTGDAGAEHEVPTAAATAQVKATLPVKPSTPLTATEYVAE